MGQRYHTVFFDLDGTLIDHLPAIHRGYGHTLPQLGLPAPAYEQVKRAIGGGLPEAMRKFVPEERVEEALAIYRPFWDRTMLEGVTIMPGGEAVLDWWREVGVMAGVFTNKHGPSARRLCTHLGLDDRLAGVFGALDTPWLKPDRRFAAYAVEALGEACAARAAADPGGVCLVGDSPFDVAAAREAGWSFCGVATGTHTEAELRAAGAVEVRDGLEKWLEEWRREASRGL
jgi:phosphoglycolate phosphatase